MSDITHNAEDVISKPKNTIAGVRTCMHTVSRSRTLVWDSYHERDVAAQSVLKSTTKKPAQKGIHRHNYQ